MSTFGFVGGQLLPYSLSAAAGKKQRIDKAEAAAGAIVLCLTFLE